MREINMDGYSVSILDGGRLVPLRYAEGARILTIDTEVLATDQAALSMNATWLARWEAPHEDDEIDDIERHRFIENIKLALGAAGVRLDAVWPFGDRMPDGTWRWSTQGRAG